MAGQGAEAPTNERIAHLLLELRTELAESKQREQELARDVCRLLERA